MSRALKIIALFTMSPAGLYAVNRLGQVGQAYERYMLHSALYCESYMRNKTRSPESEVSTTRAFETDVCQNVDGVWKIVSLH